MLEKITLFILFTGFFLFLAYLDKRFHLGMSQIDGKSLNKQSTKEDKALQKRVEVLERIVTEPKYELDKEISRLS